MAARRIRRDGRELVLTVREFDLLAFFLAHPGRAFTRPSCSSRCGAGRSATCRPSPCTCAGSGRRSSGTRLPLSTCRPYGVSATAGRRTRDERAATDRPDRRGLHRRRGPGGNRRCPAAAAGVTAPVLQAAGAVACPGDRGLARSAPPSAMFISQHDLARRRDGVRRGRRGGVRVLLAARTAGGGRQPGAAAGGPVAGPGGDGIPARRPADGGRARGAVAGTERTLPEAAAHARASDGSNGRGASSWPGSRTTCARRWRDCGRWPRRWRTASPPTRTATTSRSAPRSPGCPRWSRTCSSCPASNRAR